ncbi:MAG: AMP-dependent synthetase and ligase, partial [Acidimicrobiales bacterium]|nr:AMP-dependent synthetase and ligase [Acidimicrobiales bacterium]
MTLTSCLTEAARRFGDAPAYVAENGLTVSYADLDRLSDEVAVGLARRGVGLGDVVALALPTIPEYFVAYLAAAKLGAVTAGVNTRLSPPEQARVLDVAQPKLVLSAPEVEAAEHVDGMLVDLRVPDAAPP